MDTLHIFLLLLMSMGASFVQRVTGFGFGIFIMTVLPFLMPSYGEATTLSGLLASVTSLTIVCKYYKYLEWRKLIYILLVFVLVSFFAVQFVSKVQEKTLYYFLGIILIIVSIWFMFFSGRIHIKTSAPVQTGLGIVSGMMGGLFGMQGPPAVLYFIETADSKEKYLVISQMYFLVGNMFMTIYRAYFGFLTPAVGISWCVGIIGVFAGFVLGTQAFKHIPLPILKKIIYAYMAVSGLIFILK